MKNKNLIKGLISVLALCGFASCADDYLDVQYLGVDRDEDVFKTVDGIRMGVLGVCGRGMAATWSTDLMGVQDMACGENGITAYYGELSGNDCYYNRFNEAQGGTPTFYDMTGCNLQNYYSSTFMWNYGYAMLAQLNPIINSVDAAEGDESTKLFSKAQALTMRAHIYFRLLQVYGPRWEDSREGEYKCLVMRTGHEPQNSPLSPMKDFLKLCYDDLDNAIECFKQSSFKRELPYEPTLQICYGVYARVAAMKNDWAKVKEMAHLARQGYRPATEAEMFNGYTKFNDDEWMWSQSFLLPVDNFRFGNWCASFAANSYRARRGGASMRISRALYNQIPENDIRRNWWFTQDKTTYSAAQFHNPNFVSPVNQNITNLKVRQAALNWIAEHTPEGLTGCYVPDTDESDNSATTGCVIADGVHVKFVANGTTGLEGMCFPPFMRATEMYLYEAEACAMLGDNTTAQSLLEEINKIPTNGAYKCTLTGQALIDEVRLYRRIELWGEGFCWFDMKRWGVALDRFAWESGVADSGNLPANICTKVLPSDKNGWVYAIPREETNYNTSVAYPFDPFN